MKNCFVLAGINGSGKTEALKVRIDDDPMYEGFVYVCLDDFAAKYGSDLAAYKKAAPAFRQFVESILKGGQSFFYETTLASVGTIGELERFKEAGYAIEVQYTYVLPVEKAIERIKKRSQGGKHSAYRLEDVETFRQRFQNSLKHLATIAERGIFETARIYDNSKDLDEGANPASTIRLVAISKGRRFAALDGRNVPDELQAALPFNSTALSRP